MCECHMYNKLLLTYLLTNTFQLKMLLFFAQLRLQQKRTESRLQL